MIDGNKSLSPHDKITPIYQKIRKLQDLNFKDNEAIEVIKLRMKERSVVIGGLLEQAEVIVETTADQKFKDEKLQITMSVVKSTKVLVDENLLLNLKPLIHKDYIKTTTKFELAKFKKAFKGNEEMYQLGILKDETKETMQFRDNKYKGGSK